MTKLKHEVGEILVAGSRQLVRALHTHGLIDEYRLMVFPITVGGGKRMFENSTAQVSLRLVDARPAAQTLLLRYHPV